MKDRSDSRWHLPAVSLSVVVMSSLLQAMAAIAQAWPITLPDCPDKCGDISIPFPFGVVDKPRCFLDGFQVTCNHSFQPPRLFLQLNPADNSSSPLSQFRSFNLPSNGSFHLTETSRYDSQGVSGADDDDDSVLPVELMDISLARAEARAYGLVRSSCFKANSTVGVAQATTLGAPFALAAARNVLVGVGWRTKADLVATSRLPILECVSATQRMPLALAANGTCSGLGFCQSLVTPAITHHLTSFRVTLEWDAATQADPISKTYPCSYGMVVESSWYNFSTEDMVGYDVLPKKHPRGVPFVIDFAIRSGSCPVPGGPPQSPEYACRSGNSSCANATNGAGYVCKCLENYDGNPYIPNGCQDIDECALPDQYPCSGICVNKIGGYDCPCKLGMRGDGKAGTCTDQFPLPAKIVVGAIGAVLASSVCVFLVLLRRQKRRMKEYFDKNGGPILKEVRNIKILKKEELKPILKSNNIVGKGAFGEVYKGLLDGKQVAVKKPAVHVDASQKGQFANEVIIQSRIIHKNIVRLINWLLLRS